MSDNIEDPIRFCSFALKPLFFFIKEMLHFWIFGDFVYNLKEKRDKVQAMITLNDSFQGPLHFKILVLGNAYINYIILSKCMSSFLLTLDI